jgi:hypothetical protein
MACGPPPPEGRTVRQAGHARADAWLEALPRALVLQSAFWFPHPNARQQLAVAGVKVGLDYVPDSGERPLNPAAAFLH